VRPDFFDILDTALVNFYENIACWRVLNACTCVKCCGERAGVRLDFMPLRPASGFMFVLAGRGSTACRTPIVINDVIPVFVVTILQNPSLPRTLFFPA